jgi:hypothetical protein
MCLRWPERSSSGSVGSKRFAAAVELARRQARSSGQTWRTLGRRERSLLTEAAGGRAGWSSWSCWTRPGSSAVSASGENCHCSGSWHGVRQRAGRRPAVGCWRVVGDSTGRDTGGWRSRARWAGRRPSPKTLSGAEGRVRRKTQALVGRDSQSSRT